MNGGYRPYGSTLLGMVPLFPSGCDIQRARVEWARGRGTGRAGQGKLGLDYTADWPVFYTIYSTFHRTRTSSAIACLCAQ